MTFLLKILRCVGFVLISQSIYAQVDITTCQQRVKLAEQAYDEGRLASIDSLLLGCTKVMNHKIKVKAYQLLFMSAVYLDQTKKAKLYLKKFRKLMPRYRPKVGKYVSSFDQAWLEFKSYKSRKKKH